MFLKKISKNSFETGKIGQDLAKKILILPSQKKAFIIGLTGELGAGKTCFLQGFALELGIKEKILSPTFIIFRRFAVENAKFKNFYHFDCYRIKNEKEMSLLGFEKIISDANNIVALEWPGRIKKLLPKNFLDIKFDFVDKDKRSIHITHAP